MEASPVPHFDSPRYPRAAKLRRQVLIHAAGGLTILVVGGTSMACFGCIAICPPVYITEDDALDIIQEEFAEKGYRLRPGTRRDVLDFGLLFIPDLIDRTDPNLPVAVEFVGMGDCNDAETRYHGLVAADTGLGLMGDAESMAGELFDAMSERHALVFVAMTYPKSCEGDAETSLRCDVEEMWDSIQQQKDAMPSYK